MAGSHATFSKSGNAGGTANEQHSERRKPSSRCRQRNASHQQCTDSTVTDRGVPNRANAETIGHATSLQPRPVRLWLESLTLSPKSKTLIRGMIGVLWDFAQWRGDLPITRNPMQLVTIAGATKRVRRPRSLTPAELQMFVQHLDEPFRTLAQVSVCCRLRISEALALKWLDVNWKDGRLQIERGIVAGNVDGVKTEGSRRALFISSDVLTVLTTWRMVTEFSAESDWLFASPATIARKPWSCDQVW